MSAVIDFALRPDAEAAEPPEARGLRRDDVRLLVADATGVRHTRFSRLGEFLHAGDVVVVNTSATVPAAIDGRRRDGRAVTVHFSTRLDTDALPDARWLVEVRPAGVAFGPIDDAEVGEIIELPAEAQLLLEEPVAGPDLRRPRLWRARVIAEGGAIRLLMRHGRPIRYAYVQNPWPLRDYQTVFARDPGSAEMPSAGRPFTTDLVTDLVTRGVVLAPITLHTGVSSLDAGELPLPERFNVPAVTAKLVNMARVAGREVVAVGTTVVRALESAARRDGTVRPAHGWTSLVLGPERPAHVVTSLVTGWHAPGASHLRLLEAVAGHDLVATAYEEAIGSGYLWHEFGDSCLLRRPGYVGARAAGAFT